MEFVSVIKKSNNVRNVSKAYGDDRRKYVDFSFVEGENFVPKDLFDILSKTDFFKEQVKIGEFTVIDGVLESDVTDVNVQDDSFAATTLNGLSVAELRKKIPELKDRNALLKLSELTDKSAVAKMCEKRLKELNVKVD